MTWVGVELRMLVAWAIVGVLSVVAWVVPELRSERDRLRAICQQTRRLLRKARRS